MADFRTGAGNVENETSMSDSISYIKEAIQGHYNHVKMIQKPICRGF